MPYYTVDNSVLESNLHNILSRKFHFNKITTLPRNALDLKSLKYLMYRVRIVALSVTSIKTI